MRLFIFTNRDLAGNMMLNLLLPQLAAAHEIAVFVSEKVGKAATVPRALRQLRFFEQELPFDLLFPQLDLQNRPAGDYFRTFQELSKHYSIPFQTWNEINTPESLAYFREQAPDLVLSVRYGKIFGNTFLKIPKYGVINLHSGILPQYRGVLAVFRALVNGDQNIGATLHYIDDNTIDTGGIIGFSNVAVAPDKSLLWHIVQLYPASVPMVLDTIAQIAAGKRPPVLAQDNTQSAYYSFPDADAIAAFNQTGREWVNMDEYKVFMNKYC